VEQYIQKSGNTTATTDKTASTAPKPAPMTKQQRIQAFFESSKIYPTLQGEVTIDEELTEFYQVRKHYLIMSEAGKPIYSRYGDEEVLAPFFATVSAILHKVMSYFVLVAEREQSNRLRRISSGAFDALFMRKGNLIYICLINNKAALPDGKQFIDEAYQKQQ
jgi:hypothetical protein